MKRAKRTRSKKSVKAKAAAPPRVVKVPATPPSAYSDRRPPSQLLLKQLEHLQWAALPASERAPGTFSEPVVKTEGEAAERIGELTRHILSAAPSPAPIRPSRRPARPRTKKKRRKAR